ncbi:Hypp7802 [Branchiostoma lanceolatum]|uniref:Hypp7802 protein n=1 Tax=Branchiostoma lanceolatum TaxID=7740 RepID=A0A8J9Z453_BRALA|nr:Hypp7802 [Branchiostoma lanceolatum]
MGNTCTVIDCCFGLRQRQQCCFPCLRLCSYDHRPVFYSHDGSEVVQPLVAFFRPNQQRVRKLPVPGLTLDPDDLNLGLGPVEQIAAVCKHAQDSDLRVRAVGRGHARSQLTSVEDILIDMTTLDRILVRHSPETDVHHVVVEAGMVAEDFARELQHVYGLAVPAFGNFAGHTLGGLISTGGHGSGYAKKILADSVVELHMIIEGGIQVKIRRSNIANQEIDTPFDDIRDKVRTANVRSEPIVILSTEVFRAVAVGLGSLGVIYSLTIRCEPSFNIEEFRTPIEISWPGERLSGCFAFPSGFVDMYTVDHEFSTFVLHPIPDPTRGQVEPGFAVIHGIYFGGKRTGDPPARHNSCPCCPGSRGLLGCRILQNDCMATALLCGTSCCARQVPMVTKNGLRMLSHRSSYVHQWHNVLQLTPDVNVVTMEWFVALDELEAAVADVISMAVTYGTKCQHFSLLPIACRVLEADDFYLSPTCQSRVAEESITHYGCIEVPFLPGEYGAAQFHKVIDELLFEKYQARPHWGASHLLTQPRVRKSYPELDKWLQVYRLFNKNGTFENTFTERCGFDDLDARKKTQSISRTRSFRRNRRGFVDQRPDSSIFATIDEVDDPIIMSESSV